MKIGYIDTSVILAKWMPNDPFHAESVKIITAIESNKIKGYFSTFGMCEVISVVKRQEQKFSGSFPSSKSIGIEYIKKIRKITNINIFNDNNILNVNIGGKETEISLTYWTTINIGSKTGLKTLDNIHIAISKVISTVTKDSVDYFITGDAGILEKGKVIKNMYNISVINPRMLVQLEGF